jgi:hypothetical protein
MGVTPRMNRSAKGGARSSLHYGGEGVLIHPLHQGVCGRHGTEEQRVTSGGLVQSPGGTGESKPISESEVVSVAVSCAVQRRCFPAGAKPARQLSLRPVATRADVEVTKRLKPLV